MFHNRKHSAVLLALAAAVAALAACGAETTAPVPVTPLGVNGPLSLDTAELCPYGWIVNNGRIECEDPGTD